MTVEVVDGQEHGEATPAAGWGWRRRLAFVAASWVFAGALMLAVAAAVVSLVAPDPLPEGVPSTAPAPEPAEGNVEDPAAAAADPLAPGTCTDELARPDDGGPVPVVVVDCAAPHISEVVAQLPASTSAEGRVDACAAAAAAAGVPLGTEDPPVPFRVGAFPTKAGTVECTVSTPPVTGSVAVDGYGALELVDPDS